MKITNKNNLPAPIVNAINSTQYVGDISADFSATGLLKPAYQSKLQREHAGQLTADVSDMLWTTYGSAMHSLLERANVDVADVLVEERLSCVVNGKKITGQADIYYQDNGKFVIADLKTTSIWSVIHESSFDDWTAQLNIYAYLFRQAGMKVDELRVWVLAKDWSASKARFDKGYPQSAFINIKLALWDENRQLGFIIRMIDNHANNDKPCTTDDRWEKPTMYAAMKAKAKRAVKLFDNETNAKSFIADGKADRVDIRPGQRTRCEGYCNVSAFCPDYQRYLKEKGDE
jgi:hypothetical protein